METEKTFADSKRSYYLCYRWITAKGAERRRIRTRRRELDVRRKM